MSIQHVEGKHQLADALSRMPTINNISKIQVTDGWWDTLVQATKEDKEIQEAINDKQVSLVHGVAVKDAKNKSSNQKPAGLLQPLPIPERRWEHVTLDLVTELPTTSQGHNAIVVFVDKLSKMIHIRPTTEKITAPKVAQLFLEAVFAQHGMPTTLISDREFAYNNSLNASTNVSPFYLMYGEHPQVPASLLHQKAITTKVAATEEFATRLQSVIQAAREKLLVAQNRQKQYANCKRRDMEYMVGDQVWLSTTNLLVKGNRKLGARRIGPFSVAKCIGDVAYELSLPETMRHLHPMFHVSLLKPYISRPSTFSNPHPTPPLPQVVDDHIEYEVDRILQKRIIRRGRKVIVEYLVLWKGFPLHEATWEPIGNLTNCANILQEFKNLCNEDVAS
ncbi:unnamed protein product [Calypogeia fissa]